MLGHVRSIRWTSDGWPLVMPERYSGVPQTPIEESELVGQWENIQLSYDYGKQRQSVSFTLGEDHQVSGSWMAGNSWSYDAASRTLKVGSLELYLQRETDWESGKETVGQSASNTHTNRVKTIVYAGINGNNTYWGKKVQ